MSQPRLKGVVEMMNQVKEINFMVRYISWMNLFIAKIQQTIMVIHSFSQKYVDEWFNDMF